VNAEFVLNGEIACDGHVLKRKETETSDDGKRKMRHGRVWDIQLGPASVRVLPRYFLNKKKTGRLACLLAWRGNFLALGDGVIDLLQGQDGVGGGENGI
jgi:hypothetical protein